MIDLAELGAVIANILGAVAIIAVIVFAAVAYLKQWGVQGKALTGAGFAAGVLIAFAARFMILPPVSLQDWIATAFMGLMAGFLATGAYKGISDATGKDKIDATAVFYDDRGNITGYGRTDRSKDQPQG